MVRVGEGVHVLLPVGQAALAVTAARVEGLDLERGSFRWLAGDGAAAAEEFAFDHTVLTHEPTRLGLRDFTEKELSSRFLEVDGPRWRMARIDWGGRRSAELLRAELHRRGLIAPCLLACLVACLGLLLWRRPLTLVLVHGVCSPLVVAASLFLPRVL